MKAKKIRRTDVLDRTAQRLSSELLAGADTKSFIPAQALSLGDWPKMVKDPPENTVFSKIGFPTQNHRDEYLETIGGREESEVFTLLRCFLPCTGTHPLDLVHYCDVRENLSNEKRRAHLTEYDRRILRHVVTNGRFPVWEGIHWILDLLPHYARNAIDVLSSFRLANFQQLSDAYLTGIEDASTLIRWRYLISPHTRDKCKATLASLTPRELELVVAALYSEMGYRSVVTRYSKDGGVDVRACSERGHAKQTLLIQCKHQSSPVAVGAVRELLGVVATERATQGVLVSSSTFTRDARKIERQESVLLLIDSTRLVDLMNEHFGNQWHQRIDYWISEGRRRSASADKAATSAGSFSSSSAPR